MKINLIYVSDYRLMDPPLYNHKKRKTNWGGALELELWSEINIISNFIFILPYPLEIRLP